jgi:hypothetical protein
MANRKTRSSRTSPADIAAPPAAARTLERTRRGRRGNASEHATETGSESSTSSKSAKAPEAARAPGRKRTSASVPRKAAKSSSDRGAVAMAAHPETEGLIHRGRHPEIDRMIEDREREKPWRLWGPYVSERQWGTVREDYSADGNAWSYLPHDHARSRAYRWGEDGIAGFSDFEQRLCLTVAFWNGRDPILKERFFGLANGEGNHGEDIKELHWYLDATPSMSYLKMLYKYPQRAFPYEALVRENAARSKKEREFELLDTGIFDDDRYFDVEIEWAKASTDDILLRITAFNRGPDDADLAVLPQLFFRNTWAWEEDSHHPRIAKAGRVELVADHDDLGEYTLVCDGTPEILICENETNAERLYGQPREGRTFKDGIGDFVVDGRVDAVRTEGSGTKAAMLHRLRVPAGGSAVVRTRLAKRLPAKPFARFDEIVSQRVLETDEFFGLFRNRVVEEDLRTVQRQAFAGLVWTRQYYSLDVRRWLDGDPAQPPPPPQRKQGRNRHWRNFSTEYVLSIPDKWEYPWFAAWDLSFHCVAFAGIDPSFAKKQLKRLLHDRAMHPSGEVPAYEWAFSDANPPVMAWAAWRVYQIDRTLFGRGDTEYLKQVFHRMLLHFTWWVNRKDADGNNVFEGGFLGLDNVGIFDRSRPLPTGGKLMQADGTAWMAMFSLTMMRMSLELALEDPVYQDLAGKFFEHFLQIAQAMTAFGGSEGGLWDERDEFYYDYLEIPGGHRGPMRIPSIVGLVPLFAVEVLEPEMLERLPVFAKRVDWYFEQRPDLTDLVSHWPVKGKGERRLLSLLRGHRMKCLLRRALDPEQFLSPHGVRSMSKSLRDDPYEIRVGDRTYSVRYWPGESEGEEFGGNSNWRGPVWFPVNYLLIESLSRFHQYYGDDFRVEAPTGSGRTASLLEIADDLSARLCRLFLPGTDGNRPIHGGDRRYREDPHFKELIHFFEYFDGDTGRGCGANHQTGWTGLVAKLITPRQLRL